MRGALAAAPLPSEMLMPRRERGVWFLTMELSPEDLQSQLELHATPDLRLKGFAMGDPGIRFDARVGIGGGSRGPGASTSTGAGVDASGGNEATAEASGGSEWASPTIKVARYGGPWDQPRARGWVASPLFETPAAAHHTLCHPAAAAGGSPWRAQHFFESAAHFLRGDPASRLPPADLGMPFAIFECCILLFSVTCAVCVLRRSVLPTETDSDDEDGDPVNGGGFPGEAAIRVTNGEQSRLLLFAAEQSLQPPGSVDPLGGGAPSVVPYSGVAYRLPRGTCD